MAYEMFACGKKRRCLASSKMARRLKMSAWTAAADYGLQLLMTPACCQPATSFYCSVSLRLKSPGCFRIACRPSLSVEAKTWPIYYSFPATARLLGACLVSEPVLAASIAPSSRNGLQSAF